MFLENYYEQTDSDDVRSLLGNISLDIWKDGSTGDPAAWSEWIECIEKVTNKKYKIRKMSLSKFKNLNSAKASF